MIPPDNLRLLRFQQEYERRVRWARFGRTLQGCALQFTLWLCPPALHNRLHLIKMRLLRAG